MPVLRSFFIALSHNRLLRRFSERSRLGVRLSSRFVAGMKIDDALRVAAAVNKQGIAVTLDSLGESVTTEAEAHAAAEIYHRLLDAIAAHMLDANISVKLTQMGLNLSPALAESIAESLARHAKAKGSFVRIDMEDSSLTQATLDIVRRLHAKPELRGAIGIVIQAYLYRSMADIEQLLSEHIRVRLCKGAYSEPAEVAYPRKTDVDANYTRLSELLLASPIYHGLATHDEAMIAAAKSFASRNAIDPSRFEFQMLFGVRRDVQRKLVREGYNVRVYLPFGKDWYPYFMRRLAERPANVLFLAKNFFRW
ncbi:MAG: proline dehydrogenase family protein [Terracidiphilus sp.]